jgi:predicted regulator of Ras-like GTPase activity (Roadblock/LC7/MglB family)
VFDGVDDVATVTGVGSILQDGFTLTVEGRSTDTGNHKTYLAGSGTGVFVALAKTGSNRKVIGHVGECPELEIVVGGGMLTIELVYDVDEQEVALEVSEDGTPLVGQLQPCTNANLLGVSAWSAGDAPLLPGGVSELEGELTYLRVDTSAGCVGGDVSTAMAADQTLVLSGCGQSLVRGLTPFSGTDDPTLVCAP